MKQTNFKSIVHRALSTVNRNSALCIVNRAPFITLLLVLMVGVGEVWGETTEVPSLVPSSGSFIIAMYNNSDYYAMPYPGTSNVANLTGKKCTLNNNGQVTAIEGCSNPSACVWTFTEGTGSDAGKFQIKSSNNKYLYKAGTSGTSNHNMLESSSSQYWSFTKISSGTAKYSMKSERGSANTIMTNNSGKFYLNGTDASFVIYLLEVASACTTPISISKSSTSLPSGCSFSLDKTEGCGDGDGDAVVVTCTPASHYTVKNVSSTKGTPSAVSNNKCTVSGIKDDATISVTFEEDNHYTVEWYVAGVKLTEGSQSNIVYENEKVATIPTAPADNAAGSCATKFMGWSTSNLGSATGHGAPNDLFTTQAGSPEINSSMVQDKKIKFYAVFASEME